MADVCIFRAIAEAKFSVKRAGEFLFFHVLKGKLNFSNGEGENFGVEKDGSFILSSGEEYFIQAAQDCEILRVSLPAMRSENLRNN